jgi:hypothetical protein
MMLKQPSPNRALTRTEMKDLVTFHGGPAAVRQLLLQQESHRFSVFTNVRLGGLLRRSRVDLIEELLQKEFRVDDKTIQVLLDSAVRMTNSPQCHSIKLVIATPKALGLKDGGFLSDIYKAAATQGLVLCPDDTALELIRQHDKGWTKERHIIIASKPIKICSLYHLFAANALKLWTVTGDLGHHFEPNQKFLFRIL